MYSARALLQYHIGETFVFSYPALNQTICLDHPSYPSSFPSPRLTDLEVKRGSCWLRDKLQPAAPSFFLLPPACLSLFLPAISKGQRPKKSRWGITLGRPLVLAARSPQSSRAVPSLESGLVSLICQIFRCLNQIPKLKF